MITGFDINAEVRRSAHIMARSWSDSIYAFVGMQMDDVRNTFTLSGIAEALWDKGQISACCVAPGQYRIVVVDRDLINRTFGELLDVLVNDNQTQYGLPGSYPSGLLGMPLSSLSYLHISPAAHQLPAAHAFLLHLASSVQHAVNGRYLYQSQGQDPLAGSLRPAKVSPDKERHVEAFTTALALDYAQMVLDSSPTPAEMKSSTVAAEAAYAEEEQQEAMRAMAFFANVTASQAAQAAAASGAPDPQMDAWAAEKWRKGRSSSGKATDVAGLPAAKKAKKRNKKGKRSGSVASSTSIKAPDTPAATD